MTRQIENAEWTPINEGDDIIPEETISQQIEDTATKETLVVDTVENVVSSPVPTSIASAEQEQKIAETIIRLRRDRKALMLEIATLTQFVSTASKMVKNILHNDSLIEARLKLTPIIEKAKTINMKNPSKSLPQIWSLIKMIKFEEMQVLAENLQSGIDISEVHNLRIAEAMEICKKYNIDISGFEEIKQFFADQDENTEGGQNLLSPPNHQ